MSKRSIQVQETMYCGIDVSAASLTVAIQRVHQPIEQRSLPRQSSAGRNRRDSVYPRGAKPARVSAYRRPCLGQAHDMPMPNPPQSGCPSVSLLAARFREAAE